MQIETQLFLDMAEASGRLCCFDIEATGLRGDYNSILVVSIKPYGEPPISFCVDKPGDDEALVRAASRELDKYACRVSYFGRGFDIKMLNTRRLRWGLGPLQSRHHIDMYFSLLPKLTTARRSQAHLLRFIGTEKQKMEMSPEDWNAVLRNPTVALKKMRQRCESDTEGLEALYKSTRQFIREITRD